MVWLAKCFFHDIVVLSAEYVAVASQVFPRLVCRRSLGNDDDDDEGSRRSSLYPVLCLTGLISGN